MNNWQSNVCQYFSTIQSNLNIAVVVVVVVYSCELDNSLGANTSSVRCSCTHWSLLNESERKQCLSVVVMCNFAKSSEIEMRKTFVTGVLTIAIIFATLGQSFSQFLVQISFISHSLLRLSFCFSTFHFLSFRFLWFHF